MTCTPKHHLPYTRTAPIALLLAAVFVFHGCRQRPSYPTSGTEESGEGFAIDVLNGYTPVKDQGRSPICWAYAMLAAIETDHIMRGDSVHLSVEYVAHNVLLDNYRRYVLTAGRTPFTMRGTAQRLINSIERDGAVCHDAYHGMADADLRTLANKVKRVARKAVNTRAGLQRFDPQAADVIHETLGTPPQTVYLYSARYTPQEFARSVCAPGEYIALTSFTHHPFHTDIDLEVPDNIEHSLFRNLPIDSLMSTIEKAVRQGRGVCWEGDTSETGFSFTRGTARLDMPSSAVTQAARQTAFERYLTTDDHCMAIVGLAHDCHGHQYFIMKNSWGTNNPYHGLMYVSADYVRMKTIAVFLPREVMGEKAL